MTQGIPEYKSAFASAIEARFATRRVYEYDVDGFFGLGAKPIPRVGVRVPTKREEVAAIDQAYTIVKAMCSQPEARENVAVFEDLKVCCIAFQACRDINDPKYPAFPGPEWMFKHLTGDQLGALVALVNTVKRRESPTPVEVGDETIEALATALSASAGTAAADVILAGITNREDLDYFMVAVCDKLMTARADLADYVKEQDATRVVAEAGTETTP